MKIKSMHKMGFLIGARSVVVGSASVFVEDVDSAA